MPAVDPVVTTSSSASSSGSTAPASTSRLPSSSPLPSPAPGPTTALPPPAPPRFDRHKHSSRSSVRHRPCDYFILSERLSDPVNLDAWSRRSAAIRHRFALSIIQDQSPPIQDHLERLFLQPVAISVTSSYSESEISAQPKVAGEPSGGAGLVANTGRARLHAKETRRRRQTSRICNRISSVTARAGLSMGPLRTTPFPPLYSSLL